jgi:hypothetical protein
MKSPKVENIVDTKNDGIIHWTAITAIVRDSYQI